ncbi:TSUP family transporter [Mechercharimyces sp. CAU 1602]|uniref:TSUP family transporter n=1 Tax=Mechercharimyces sp. CAU 1602 TaxID=2973933 RepID=UPI002163CAB2|nr:TSUP family transporter [Mechercharimyces sp. CAU 1602]MCS1351445.1 TSUP family transporter [Mechercharimyces sp. CAU 1602]
MENMSLEILLFLIAAGFLAAFVDSVVGGGGLVSIPALLFTGLPPSLALGTNKLASTMGALTSTLSFLKSGKINKKLVLMLFPLAVVGSAVGVYVVQLISSAVLKPLILVLLVGVTIYTVMSKRWGSESTFTVMTRKLAIFIGLAAMIIGFYDGFLGAGTGSFLIFSFLLLGFDFVEAAGNAKVLNFGSNLAALIAFIYFDSVHFGYGVPMGIAMVIGAAIGSNLAIRKGAAYVKALFVSVTVIFIGKGLWDYLTSM